MALVLKDRVKQLSVTTGTGFFALSSTFQGFQSFSSAVGDGNTTYYTIFHENNDEWEVGIGTVAAGAISRDTVLSSSNGGALVNFTSGTKVVFCDYPAEKAVYKDADGNLVVDGGIQTPTFIDFNTAYSTTLTEGQLGWDGNNTLGIGMAGGNVVQRIGEDQFFYCKATSAIAKGQVVMFTGAVGASGVPTGAPATGITDGTYIMGIAAEAIANNGFGLVQSFGTLRNVNTTGYADGDILWYNPSIAGGLTKTKPSAPNVKVQMAAVINGGSSGGGTILIRINPGSVLGGTDSNVEITSPTTGQSLIYNSSTGVWANGNNEVINGGAIDNTPIGATTPSTGVFTTLTAQTEVLKGTGQNLVTYSNTFTNAAWQLTAATTATTVATTDPFGGSSAYKLAEDNTASAHYVFNTASVITGINYTASVYVKAAERNWVQLTGQAGGFGANFWANFDLTNGVVGSVGSAVTASITSIGSGWYRCSIVGVATATTSSGGFSIVCLNANTAARFPSYTGTTGSGVYIYGAQEEIGSVTNSYTTTTSAAIYGTPSLSFSGVAGIGLESNGSLYETSAGAGSIRFYTNNIAQEQLRVSHTASAVNYVQVTGSATTVFPAITAQGSDTNIGLRISSKGTQSIRFDNNNTANQLFRIDGSATAAVNYLQVSGVNTTFEPLLSAQGTDANISMALQSKGTGGIDLATGSTGVNISNGTTVTAITRTATGSGYTSAPTVAISAPQLSGGVQATATSTINGAGTVTINNGGTGYTVGDTVTVVGGTGTAAQLTVGTVSAGVITSFSGYAATGSYSVAPTFPASVTGGTGTGATVTFAMIVNSTFTITNAGSGYVEQPTVSFSGGGGSGAAAYATVGSGTVVRGLGSSIGFFTPGGESFRVEDGGATLVNYLKAVGVGANSSPYFTVQGSDTNINFDLYSKGTGSIRFRTGLSPLQFQVSHTASAVNYVQVTGAATGAAPVISAQGSDANAQLVFQSKGASGLVFQTRGGGTARTALQLVDSGAASVNSIQIASNIATAAPTISTFGSDTNIDLALTPKGTGRVKFGTYTASVLTPTGYIEIVDAGGTVRRLLVG